MTNEQLKVLFKSYLDQLRHIGKCEVNLPHDDFEAMKKYVKERNYTTTESNVDDVLNVHISGKVIKIGGY
jgi:hypothetical protein